jgi:hypothetical protein
MYTYIFRQIVTCEEQLRLVPKIELAATEKMLARPERKKMLAYIPKRTYWPAFYEVSIE